jgi:hypothetical protein
MIRFSHHIKISSNSTKYMSEIKVRFAPSTIPKCGTGLFAMTDIKKDSIIVEFKGKLRKPYEKLNSNRSNIYFNDESILKCPVNDLASYAQDAINFTGTRRFLMKALHSDIPFYEKHPNAKINAAIQLKDKLHRAFLIAEDDIINGEEIFCHYGFDYWFKREIGTIGFLQEDEIEEFGFPKKIYEHPGFLSYIKNFYPRYVRHEVKKFGNGRDFIIHLDNKQVIIMPMPNYARRMQRLTEKDANKIIKDNKKRF